MAVFRVVALCSLVETDRPDRSDNGASKISEMSINFYRNIRRNFPEDRHFHARRRENLKYYLDHG
jgi:hypothetical protein